MVVVDEIIEVVDVVSQEVVDGIIEAAAEEEDEILGILETPEIEILEMEEDDLEAIIGIGIN